MQAYDLLMLAVMVGAILFGVWKGLAWQVASLAAVVVSYFVAINFRGPVANLIGAEPPWDRFLAMFLLFVGTSLAIWFAFGYIKETIEKMHLNSFDRQVGGLVGAIKGALLCIIITLFAVSLLGDSTRRAICTSYSGNYISRAIANLSGVMPAEISQHIDPYINRFHAEMEKHKDNQPGQPMGSGVPLTDPQRQGSEHYFGRDPFQQQPLVKYTASVRYTASFATWMVSTKRQLCHTTGSRESFAATQLQSKRLQRYPHPMAAPHC